MSGPNTNSKWRETRKGFRHKAIEAMRSQGLSYREARQVMEIFVQEMKNSLARGEKVCFDWGTLQNVGKTESQRAWRFGRVITLNSSPFKVVPRQD